MKIFSPKESCELHDFNSYKSESCKSEVSSISDAIKNNEKNNL